MPTMSQAASQAIEIYAEGGSIHDARNAAGISGRDFYAALRADPQLQQRYYDTQTQRADMMVDEAYQISGDNEKPPGVARVQAEIKLKIAAAFDRKRFGEKVDMTIDQTLSVAGALEAAKARSLRPRRDLASIPDGEVTEIAQLLPPQATDKKSDAPTFVPDPAVNPLDD